MNTISFSSYSFSLFILRFTFMECFYVNIKLYFSLRQEYRIWKKKNEIDRMDLIIVFMFWRWLRPKKKIAFSHLAEKKRKRCYWIFLCGKEEKHFQHGKTFSIWTESIIILVHSQTDLIELFIIVKCTRKKVVMKLYIL